MRRAIISRGRAVTAAVALAAGALCLQAGWCQAQGQPGPTIRSAPCTQAPRIDGRFRPGEWAGATRYAFEMVMHRVDGTAKPRPAVLYVMNSAENLYLALRVPDASREASLNPVNTDLMVLAFCKGAALAAGDDRKVLIPGVYADKHVVTPARAGVAAKDADDKVANGKGAMAWAKGEWTAEYGLPLNSGDGEDLAAAPGDRVRFNLLFADNFAPDLKGTEYGGVFTATADDAKGWGYLALATDVGKEKPAPDPAWLVKLFPYTGEPDECAHRLRRVEATEIPVGDDFGGQVTCQFLCHTTEGKTETAQARIFVPPVLRRDPKARVPLMCNAGYELEPGAAAALLAKGWVVSTPHADLRNPLDRGPDLDIALLHAARALPFVDDSRVMIQGGSAGGYTTLMLEAESFPLVCAIPLVPPVNWGYNAAYMFHNRRYSTAEPKGAGHPAMPVLAAVTPIADASAKTLGTDTDADSYLMSSPISQLDTITAPTEAVWSTGDMLVPINQVGAQFVRGLKPGDFPAGFTMSIDELMQRPQTRKTLLDLLPKSAYEAFVVPVPPKAPVLDLEKPPEGPMVQLTLPFSKTRTWSIVVVDEGQVEPDAGHMRHAFMPVTEPFLEWALARGIQPEQLTEAKLTRLMMRLAGKEWRPFTIKPAGATAPIAAVRLDFPAAERQDVLRGLIAFAGKPGCAQRLAECYDKLSDDLKLLGPSLGHTPGEITATLARALGGVTSSRG